MAAESLRNPSPLRREPVLPPGFSLVTLRESGDAFAHACAHAGELGAATLVWVRRFDVVEFALVLEPEEPLVTARLAHYLCMNALADSLAAHCPPERPVTFNWPDALIFDHGLIGGGRFGWPADCADDEVPEWTVFAGMVRASSQLGFEDAVGREGISMEEEGFGEVDAVDIVESFCRHVMLGVSHWRVDGPKSVVRRWLDRLPAEEGLRRGIEPNGDLVLKTATGEERRGLVPALARADWYDAERGEPKL